MGIYDREYYREQQGAAPRGMRGSGRGPAGIMPGWSVNTWLIVICVAVFAIDNYVMPAKFRAPVQVSRDLPIGVQVVGGAQYRDLARGDETRSLHFVRDVVDVSQEPAVIVGTVTYEWMPPLTRWLYFSTESAIRRFEFWRFIGFQFLHANTSHLLFNMIGLFFFGSLVEQYLGSKRYLAFYLLCGVFGALLYLFLNLLGITASLVLHEGVRIPGLLFTSPVTPLVGASAGIFGIIMAGAYLAPRATVLVFFILPMQLRTVAYALIGIALFTILFGGHNAGGEAGHLGGAIAGWYFIRHPQHLHGFFDFLGRADPTSHHYRRGRAVPRPAGTGSGNAEIDRILDKISVEGMRSLTEEEKRTLSEASRRGR